MDRVNFASPSVLDEMQRQAEDARLSFNENGEVAAQVAEAARRNGRLVLLGMGASHAANRVVEPLYRAAGLDATAIVASEVLDTALPARDACVLLASQSGESGEIVAYLARPDLPVKGGAHFGLTLNRDSTLARSAPSLIGHGGVEKAFAATRSLYLSVALHARVLHELGAKCDAVVETATRSEPLPFEAALAALRGVDAIVFSGRAAMQGVAEAAALATLELSRVPAFALEGGQLRHGPVEALGPKLAVIFVRGATSADSTAALARVCVEGGSPTIVLDLSGEAPVEGATTVVFPAADGLEAALTVLPTLQRLMVAFAATRVEIVGQPVRSSKVTRET